MTASDPSGSSPPGDIFATTHWTVVLAAGSQRTPQSDAALEQLCKTYWFPLYAYVRRRGHSREDAEDLTQAFFARFLEKNYLEGLSAERGRFRAFLLASLKHFLANEWDKSRRQKRGGDATHLSLDWRTADTQFQLAANAASPDEAFDREWAAALLGKVLQRLHAGCACEGREEHFYQLKHFLGASKSMTSYAEAAGNLRMTEGAARVAVHRLRKRYRELLRDEISQTLSGAQEVEEELRALFHAFSGK